MCTLDRENIGASLKKVLFSLLILQQKKYMFIKDIMWNAIFMIGMPKVLSPICYIFIQLLIINYMALYV